jgi:HEAT repeat protein
LTAHGWKAEKKRKPLGNESFESLLQRLRGGDDGDAGDVLAELARRRDQRAVKPLLEFIVHPRNWARGSALLALGKIGDPSAVAPLIEFITSDAPRDNGNWDDRTRAIKALGELRAKQAIEPLIAVASDAGSYGPHAAIEALGKIGDDRCLAALDTVFKTSPETSVRQSAWRALREARCRTASGNAQAAGAK